MHHRILDAVHTFLGTGNLDDVIEMDETFFAESFKGGHQSYIGFAKDLGLEHHRVPKDKHKIGVYHIQCSNSRHSRLKDFIDRFKGVSTKYLGNYLY